MLLPTCWTLQLPACLCSPPAATMASCQLVQLDCCQNVALAASVLAMLSSSSFTTPVHAIKRTSHCAPQQNHPSPLYNPANPPSAALSLTRSKFQKWENGQAGEAHYVVPQKEQQ